MHVILPFACPGPERRSNHTVKLWERCKSVSVCFIFLRKCRERVCFPEDMPMMVYFETSFACGCSIKLVVRCMTCLAKESSIKQSFNCWPSNWIHPVCLKIQFVKSQTHLGLLLQWRPGDRVSASGQMLPQAPSTGFPVFFLILLRQVAMAGKTDKTLSPAPPAPKPVAEASKPKERVEA